jgi:hypothetical protein
MRRDVGVAPEPGCDLCVECRSQRTEAMMMIRTVVAGLALVAAGTLSAIAQDKTIVEERPAVTIPVPGVTIERRERPVVEERRTIETDGRGGCDSKTVRKDGPEGSTTVKKERCN